MAILNTQGARRLGAAALIASIALLAAAPAGARPGDPRTIQIPSSGFESRFRPSSSVAIAAAGSKDIACVTADQPHMLLVYAHPSDRPARLGRFRPLLRQAAYRMSAFVRSEARRRTPRIDMRFKVLCEHGAPVVAQLDLTTTAAKTNFGTIYTDAWESHVVSSYRTEDGHDHALIYADGVDNGFVLGESLTPTEDVLSETNGALMSGGISVTYIDPMQKAPKPDWITMLHEYTHSLGAVQDSAPHSSDYSGHCTDGPDIMCSEVYGDNNAHACTFVEFDCNGDDYFNPAPKPSSYLASHWNVGSPLNFYIERGTAPADRSTPTPPRNLRVSRGLLRWSPATDDIGVLGYRIDCNTAWRGWFPIAMTPNLRVSTKVCNRAVRVRAVDAAGRTSLPAALKRRR